jgi:hypothetical protein
MGTLVFAIIVTAAGQVQRPSLPSPDQILRVQESQARERSIGYRELILAERQQPAAPAVVPATPRTLPESERREIHEALDRFFRENPGVVIDARTGRAIDN